MSDFGRRFYAARHRVRLCIIIISISSDISGCLSHGPPLGLCRRATSGFRLPTRGGKPRRNRCWQRRLGPGVRPRAR